MILKKMRNFSFKVGHAMQMNCTIHLDLNILKAIVQNLKEF